MSRFRWALAVSLILGAALVAGLGVRRSFYLGLTTVLIPVELDTRERALLIAAGSGNVPTVRALLAQGVRAEPEAFSAAIIGAFDPMYGANGCARHAEVAQLLLDANPRLKPGKNARAQLVRRATSIRRCEDVNRLIAN